MISAILELLTVVAKAWSEERRTRFFKKHEQLITNVKEAEGLRYPEYSDDKVALAKRELGIFLTAFKHEIEEDHKEKGIV